MSKKAIIVLLVLSVVTWFVTRILQTIISYSLNSRGISFSGSNCSATGYPIALCTDEDISIYMYYLANIVFWFLILWLLWWVIRKFLLKR